MTEFSENIEKFLLKIPRSPRWRFSGGCIRIRGAGRSWCPLTYVAQKETGKNFLNCEFDVAGGTLGLTFEESQLVAKAADGWESPLRARLLEACGLEEEA